MFQASRRAVWLALALVLAPAILRAQDVAGTFDQLQQVVKAGQAVVVTDVDGERIKGTIASFSPLSMTIDVEDRAGFPDGQRTFSEAAVARVAKRDPVTEGLLIGLAAGVGSAWGAVRITCGPPGYDQECAANSWGVFALAMIPAGMVTGALIDRLIGNGAIFEAPATRPGVRFAWCLCGRRVAPGSPCRSHSERTHGMTSSVPSSRRRD